MIVSRSVIVFVFVSHALVGLGRFVCHEALTRDTGVEMECVCVFVCVCVCVFVATLVFNSS